MIYDAALLLASAQAYTLATPSTDFVDTLATGNDYKGCIFVVQITTAATLVTAGATAAGQFSLQTSNFSTFALSDTVTLVSSAIYTSPRLTAGKYIALPIPSGARRYLRGFFQPTSVTATNSFSAIAWNMFINEDVDETIDGRKRATNVA